PGWPVTLWDIWGQTGSLFFASPVLANFDGDALPEVYINHRCDTVVLDGSGEQLTYSDALGITERPSMYMSSALCAGTTPAVADIDLDGTLEVVRAAGT
ncbi:MAG: hypothetical protein GWN58_02705, partial [Anaerolineae bacterium]|nr:hypothetical protein [Anaerolineae bacterium]